MQWTWWRSLGTKGTRSKPIPGDWLSFALVGRDAPPASLIAQMAEADGDQTHRLRQRWAAELARLEGLLSSSDALLLRAAGGLPPQFFSAEHQWASLMERLRGMNAQVSAETWRRALNQYCAFLRACLALVTLLEGSRGARSGGEFATTAMFPTDDLPTRIPTERLDPGQAREFRLRNGQSLRLRLGSHDFSLQLRPIPALLDDQGRRYPLPAARCQVGRHSDCDLCLGDDFRSVSRRHVLLELLPGDVVRLTDQSSYGTWVIQPQLFGVEVLEWAERPAAPKAQAADFGLAKSG